MCASEATRKVVGRLPAGPCVEVTWQGGNIVTVSELAEPAGPNTPLIAPGFIDIQVNGYGGYNIQDPALAPETVAAMVRRLWCEGVTSVCPTIITRSHAALVACLSTIDEMCRQYPREARSILGIHLEGPYISPEDGPRGAHNRADVRPANIEEFNALQQAAGGRIALVTVAPEVPGAIELIKHLAAQGIVASIGHTGADAEQLAAAVAAGARLSTHLGNGAHAVLPRHPNYIWEQLAEDRLTASIITDGHHLPPAVVKCMVRVKGTQRIVLISDCMYEGGLAPGLYPDPCSGGMAELRPDGSLRIPGTPYLAGSASNLRQCIAAACRMTELPLAEVLPMATERPADLLHRPALGRLAAGARADIVLFCTVDGELQIEETILAGETVYRRS